MFHGTRSCRQGSVSYLYLSRAVTSLVYHGPAPQDLHLNLDALARIPCDLNAVICVSFHMVPSIIFTSQRSADSLIASTKLALRTISQNGCLPSVATIHEQLRSAHF
jgi:hypothetical protein